MLRRNSYADRYGDLIVTAMPEAARVHAAVLTLNQQHLAVYQRLLKVGLTTPGDPGQPFTTRRSLTALACIEVFPAGYPEYAFFIHTPEQAERVVEHCEQLMAAINAGQQKCHPAVCCPLATRQRCVCIVKYTCPVHGGGCHGSHD